MEIVSQVLAKIVDSVVESEGADPKLQPVHVDPEVIESPTKPAMEKVNEKLESEAVELEQQLVDGELESRSEANELTVINNESTDVKIEVTEAVDQHIEEPDETSEVAKEEEKRSQPQLPAMEFRVQKPIVNAPAQIVANEKIDDVFNIEPVLESKQLSQFQPSPLFQKAVASE